MAQDNAELTPVAVLFAGGTGTRLWPISTAQEPKQLNRFFSSDTLFLEAYRRVRSIFDPENILVVTTQELLPQIQQLVSLDQSQIIAQPENADTTCAVALAALSLSDRYLNPLALMFYSDHMIEDTAQFKKDISQVIELARQHQQIITIGTPPTAPVVDFGYIQVGQAVEQDLYTVVNFAEKPDKQTAQKYVSTGNYLWNTGLYVWRPQMLLQQIKKHQSSLYTQLVELRAQLHTQGYEQAIAKWYQASPHVSFEKSISEKVQEMLVYQANYIWYDLGNWRTVLELQPKDEYGNAVVSQHQRQVKTINSSGCFVYAQAKKVGLVGVRDLIIVQTEQEILVCHKDSAAEVKQIASS